MNTDIGLIIAIVGVGLAIIGVVISMMFWSRTEANSLRAEQKEDRRELMQISRNLELTVTAIQAEIKEFHRQMYELQSKR